MKALSIPIIAAAVLLGAAPPSPAAQQQREVVERIDEEGGFTIDCGDFGRSTSTTSSPAT